MNKLLLLLTLAPTIAFGQTTLIPDANFEQALIDLGYDSGIPDGSVPTTNIDTVTYLNVFGSNISDLTGLEDFSVITVLVCESNQLTSLNVSQNTTLLSLYCSNNQLTSLDLSSNTALTYLGCSNNQLTSLDLSSNTALTYLECASNQLASLDVTSNTALTLMSCSTNLLTSIDVSNNLALYWLNCHVNQLTSLDLGINSALERLRCWDNQLTCINMQNGNNTNVTHFYAQNNPSLVCIEVDDATYSNSNWSGAGFDFDSQTSFSNNCNYIPSCGSGTTSIIEYPTRDNQLIQITDILGRAILPTPNQIMFYKYNNGSVEKRIILESSGIL